MSGATSGASISDIIAPIQESIDKSKELQANANKVLEEAKDLSSELTFLDILNEVIRYAQERYNNQLMILDTLKEINKKEWAS
jgi:hypothetical protein